LIWVTRLNGERFVINSDHIEIVEANPDTVITLTNGNKYVVKESIDEIIDEVVEFRRRIFSDLFKLDKG